MFLRATSPSRTNSIELHCLSPSAGVGFLHCLQTQLRTHPKKPFTLWQSLEPPEFPMWDTVWGITAPECCCETHHPSSRAMVGVASMADAISARSRNTVLSQKCEFVPGVQWPVSHTETRYWFMTKLYKFGCWIKLAHPIHKRHQSSYNFLSISFSPWGSPVPVADYTISIVLSQHFHTVHVQWGRLWGSFPQEVRFLVL